MRVLVCGTTYYPALNGQSVFTVNLAEGLARAGHDVVVLFPEERSTARVRNRVRLEAAGALSLWFIHTDTFVPVAFGKVRRLFDEFRPEIVHIQDHYPLSGAAFQQARRLGVPVIGTNHFVPANLAHYVPGFALLGRSLERAMWSWMLHLYRRLDLVTAPSQAAVTLLKKQGLQVPAFGISCGIDLDRFRPDPQVDRRFERTKYGLQPDGPLFITVGRVDKEKHIDVLIRAVSQADRPDVQLVVVGEGAAAPELKALVHTLRLEQRVRFLGRVPNEELPRLLNAADVFAMASEAELLSIASLEAMGTGLPLLLADALALPELVTHGSNGYLFSPGDIAGAADAIRMLAEHPERWPEMGRLSLEKALAHSLDNTIERYSTLYVRAIESVAVPHGVRKGFPNRGTDLAHRSGRS